jgi:Ca2+-dependent lipid-binding protein
MVACRFVKVRLEGSDVSLTRRTRTQSTTLSPHWGETLILPVRSSGRRQRLVLEVWDEDERPWPDELMGAAELDLAEVERRTFWHGPILLEAPTAAPRRIVKDGHHGLPLLLFTATFRPFSTLY